MSEYLRKIDALVSQHIMNKVAYQSPLGPWWENEPDEEEPAHPLPRYSLDIAAAWQVVEKMRERPVYVVVEPHPDYWRAVVYDENWYFVVSEHADTAPFAICLAALRAVGVEVPVDV